MYRTLIHIPHGILCSIISEYSWAMAIVFGFVFVFGYEFNEDRYLNDEAWKDIRGFLVGVAIYFIVRVIGNLAGWWI